MKIKRLGISLSCMLAVVIFAWTARAREADTTLRWKFAAGQKRAFVLTQKVVMAAEVQGQKIDSTLTQTTELAWEIKGVDKDGTADVVQKIDRVKFQLMTPRGKLEADTADGPDVQGPAAAVSKIFRAMVGAPFTMKVTSRGEFRDFAVPPKLLEEFKAAGPAGAMFANEEAIKNMCGQAMLVFPADAVSEGKSWKDARKMQMPFGTMAMDMKYTLEKPTGSVENIGVDVKVDLEPKADTPAEIKVKSQNMQGLYKFDNAEGILKSYEVVQKMGLLSTEQGQEIAQDFESTNTLELKPETGSKK